MGLSAVINTWNEEKNILKVINSAAPFVDELIVCDMHSTDQTVALAKKAGARVWDHPYTSYVEPARNFAINKANGNWIILLDADETLPEHLGQKLKRLIEHGGYDFYRIPRKNIIFNKWIRHSGWWPDYQIRLFKKGCVTWNEQIHSIPVTTGKGIDMRPDEANALVHNHYNNISQYLERMNRYTTEQAKEKIAEQYEFNWKNIIKKPGNEFLSRFFGWEGYKDGLHGLVLSLLQTFSSLVVELKIWEQQGFKEPGEHNFLEKSFTLFNKFKSDLYYWYFSKKSLGAEGLSGIILKIRAKIKM